MTPPQVDDLPRVLTLLETAKVLRCSKAHASKLLRGKVRGVTLLPSIKLGRRVLVKREALEQWLSQQN